MIEGYFDNEWMYFPDKKLRVSIHAVLVKGRIPEMKKEGTHYRHYNSSDLDEISDKYDANVIASSLSPGVPGKYLFHVKSLKSIEYFDFSEPKPKPYRPLAEPDNKNLIEILSGY